MIESLPRSLWSVGSATREQLTVWHPSPVPLLAAPQWVTDLERWVNEGGRGDDPDLRLTVGRLTVGTDASSPSPSGGGPR